MRALRFDRATSKGRGFGRISCLSALLGLLCVCVVRVHTVSLFISTPTTPSGGDHAPPYAGVWLLAGTPDILYD